MINKYLLEGFKEMEVESYNVRHRRGTVEDADILLKWHKQLYDLHKKNLKLDNINDNELKDAIIKDFNNSNKTVFIAEAKSKDAGFIEITNESDKKIGHINALWVDTGSRGLKIGEYLLKIVINYYIKLKYSKIELAVYDFNTNAISLYKKLKFKLQKHENGRSVFYLKL